MKYLLDTNAWINILNKPTGSVATNLAKLAPTDIALCSVALAELLVGVYKSPQQEANHTLIQQLVRQFICLPFDEGCADHYAKIRAHLESIGRTIGPYDLQIAAIAIRHHLTVVTHNLSEFARVPGLTAEDWQVP